MRRSKEYQVYKSIKHWKPINEIILMEELADSKDPLAPLFFYLYNKTKEEYKKFPQRKDGQDSFIHPLNVVWNLKQAGVENYITLCAAIVHDLVEELVDYYKKEKNLKEQGKSIKILDQYEEEVSKTLQKDLLNFCKKNKINPDSVKEIIALIKLLTRHKRHLYYHSLSAIFIHPDKVQKKRAIQIKLADRLHNIQTISCYDYQGKIYQAFKNLFILNNVKNFLIEIDFNPDRGQYPTEKLFKKCAKATYNAFLLVCKEHAPKILLQNESLLQLAFRKYIWVRKGLSSVTQINEDETHPMRLFQGIVRKYDARLHQEWDSYQKQKDEEIIYCKKFFADFNFDDKQLESIIYYKDAYALKEVIIGLIYKKNYSLKGFGCSELCTRGQKCLIAINQKKLLENSPKVVKMLPKQKSV
jgi:hypothetical protein